MDKNKAKYLFNTFSSAMAFVEVKSPAGDIEIGSAFHIGNGIFVTARHVVYGKEILQIKPTEPVAISTREKFPFLTEEDAKSHDIALLDWTGQLVMHKHFQDKYIIEEGPYFLEDENIDLAILKIRDMHNSVPAIKLGLHLDDWVFRQTWALDNVIVLGYPPIPMTTSPLLIASQSQIQAYCMVRHSPKLHFILSAVPRGGFSGGVALHEEGFAIGVVTSALTRNGLDAESGYMAVLSVESIHELLERKSLVPDCVKAAWKMMGL